MLAGINFLASKWSLDELRQQVSCDTSQQGTQVSKQLLGKFLKASVQQLTLTEPTTLTLTVRNNVQGAEQASACRTQRCFSAAV